MYNSGQLLAFKKVVVLYDLVHDVETVLGFYKQLTAYIVDAMAKKMSDAGKLHIAVFRTSAYCRFLDITHISAWFKGRIVAEVCFQSFDQIHM